MTPLFSIEISLAAHVQNEVLEECVAEAQFLETKFLMYTTYVQISSTFMASCVWTLLSQAALPPDDYHSYCHKAKRTGWEFKAREECC